jgi:hypothetical protein
MEDLMLAAVPIAPIAMFGGILVVIVVVVVWSTRKTRENLTRLARDLGLQLREKPPVLGLFRSMPTVDGELRGRKVRFFEFSTGSGKNRTGWSAVGVACANPHGLKLQLVGQNFLTNLGKHFGMQDVTLGDPAFDEKFVVQTNAPEFLGAALLPEIRDPLLRHWPFMLGRTTLKIEGDEVVYAETGGFTDEKMLQRMKSLLDVLIALAALPEVYPG